MKLVVVKSQGPGHFVRVEPETSVPRYDADVYPESTDTLCWHCCHAFECRPVPLALSYDSKREAFRVYGTFCSFECAGAYARDTPVPGSSGGAVGMAMFQMFREVTGCTDPRRYRKAPPRCMLRAFGGTMTIEEFRAASGDDRPELVRVPRKCILIEQVYHERRASTSHMHVTPSWARNAPTIRAGSTGIGGGETLKLKRKYQQTEPAKARPAKKTILEQALGIA